MSTIRRVEEELVQIKEEFSQIPPVRTNKPVPVQAKKRSHPGIILAVVVILVIVILALVFLLL
jgi:hypothetical protein